MPGFESERIHANMPRRTRAPRGGDRGRPGGAVVDVAHDPELAQGAREAHSGAGLAEMAEEARTWLAEHEEAPR
jgi:hypothetical protein